MKVFRNDVISNVINKFTVLPVTYTRNVKIFVFRAFQCPEMLEKLFNWMIALSSELSIFNHVKVNFVNNLIDYLSKTNIKALIHKTKDASNLNEAIIERYKRCEEAFDKFLAALPKLARESLLALGRIYPFSEAITRIFGTLFEEVDSKQDVEANQSNLLDFGNFFFEDGDMEDTV